MRRTHDRSHADCRCDRGGSEEKEEEEGQADAYEDERQQEEGNDEAAWRAQGRIEWKGKSGIVPPRSDLRKFRSIEVRGTGTTDTISLPFRQYQLFFGDRRFTFFVLFTEIDCRSCPPP